MFSDQTSVTRSFEPHEIHYPSVQVGEDAEAMAALFVSPSLVDLVTRIQGEIRMLRVEIDNACFVQHLVVAGDSTTLDNYREAAAAARRAAELLTRSIEVAHQRMRFELSGLNDTTPSTGRFIYSLGP
jgi:hypothetical protein